jgi:hypothetical protein
VRGWSEILARRRKLAPLDSCKILRVLETKL